MANSQVFGPPEARERRGTAGGDLAVMDNKKEACMGRAVEKSEEQVGN